MALRNFSKFSNKTFPPAKWGAFITQRGGEQGGRDEPPGAAGAVVPNPRKSPPAPLVGALSWARIGGLRRLHARQSRRNEIATSFICP